MKDLVEQLGNLMIVPVVVLKDAKNAKSLAEALIKGGLPCAEVTFRTEAAEESIKIISENYPDMLVGAGTVLSIEQVDRAVNAGAKFIVSPCFDTEVVDYCISKNIPIFPGIVTPSEAVMAVKRGMNVVKFFPAEQFGGASTIKAISAVFQQLRFIPTGGVNTKNLPDYLNSDKMLCCGGSWMVKSDMIENGEFDKITEMTIEAVKLAKSIRG